MKEVNLFVELIKIQNSELLNFSLYIKGNRYQLKNIKILEKIPRLLKKR